MTSGDDSFNNPGSASVMARLKRLVSGPEPYRPGPAASAILDSLNPPPPREEKAPEPAPDLFRVHDTEREAAMNYIRRQRIRAA